MMKSHDLSPGFRPGKICSITVNLNAHLSISVYQILKGKGGREIGKYHNLDLGYCYLNHTGFVQLSALPQKLQKLPSLVAFVLLPCKGVERSDSNQSDTFIVFPLIP